ncbi:unnamed protein product [Auanema sp. JU1783]|nr:unnamed protein product [Auanema sp. JU1783]
MDRHLALLFVISIWALSKQYNETPEKGYTCLIGTLSGTQRGSGTGNLFFELLNFIAIARAHDRIPVLRDPLTKTRLRELQPIFPNLRGILPNDNDVYCGKEKRMVLKSAKCCVYEPDLILENNLTRPVSLNVEFYYLQSYKYFINETSLDIRHILKGSTGIKNMAKTEMVDPRILAKSKFNICIHIRRGDYMLSWRHEPTRKDFTLAITDHLNKKYANYSPSTIVLGNDPMWAEKTFRGYNVHIAPFSPLNPPNVDWEFSRLFCDVVALTASASTYGWWMAFMSRGGNVYYNRKFSQPYGIELELNPEDFFPADWTSLYLKNGKIYES